MSLFAWTPADKQTDLLDDDELEDYNKPEHVSHFRVFQHDINLKATLSVALPGNPLTGPEWQQCDQGAHCLPRGKLPTT